MRARDGGGEADALPAVEDAVADLDGVECRGDGKSEHDNRVSEQALAQAEDDKQAG